MRLNEKVTWWWMERIKTAADTIGVTEFLLGISHVPSEISDAATYDVHANEYFAEKLRRIWNEEVKIHKNRV